MKSGVALVMLTADRPRREGGLSLLAAGDVRSIAGIKAGWWPRSVDLEVVARSTARESPVPDQASALALIWSNSAWVIVPASSKALALAICAAGSVEPETERM